ncbi:MAG: hypothetical protein N3J91_04235 [Verrucomicrobiae bacterium]|nr:hypothetical protein [Verrucomicrobiae bacterium]
MRDLFEPYIISKEVPEGFEVFHRDDHGRQNRLLLRFAIRSQQLPQGLKAGETEAERVIEAIKCQQKVVLLGAKHLAPIYYFHEDERGIWYVTDRFRGTVEDWVTSGCNHTRIYTVVSDVLAGLSELMRKSSPPRGHGNLQTSTVFYQRGTWLKRERYVLSDLKPLPAHANMDDVIGNDLQALAKIIYLLIKGQPLPDESLNPEEEWSSLSDLRKRRFTKAQALHWFQKCNQLCNHGYHQSTTA